MENTCDNNRDCPCTYACPNHGKCCACVAHHRDHNEGVLAASFPQKLKRPTTAALKLWLKITASSNKNRMPSQEPQSY